MTSLRESTSSSGSSESEERNTPSTTMLAAQKTASPQRRKLFTERPKMLVASPKRKKLQTLQPTAKPGQLAGNNTILRFLDKKSMKRKSCSDREQNKLVKLRGDLPSTSRTTMTTPVIYNDQDSSSNDSSSSDGSKSLAQEALDIVKNEPASESYWQEVAEERRLALENALKENKDLHEQLEEKKAVIKEKDAEIECLKEMAKQTEDILSILKPKIEDEENPGGEEKIVEDSSSSSSHTQEEVATSSQEGSDAS